MMQLGQDFMFSAARKLPSAKGTPLHGHKYRLRVVVKGELNEDGMITESATIRKITKDLVLKKLDGSYLNDYFKNPTLENVGKWIWDELYDLNLVEITLWENPELFVRITPDEKKKK